MRGKDERGLVFELQACNGIERWLENFPRIQLICPLVEGNELRASHSTVWKPVSEIANVDRVKFVPLPFVTSLRAYTSRFGPGSRVDSAGDQSIAISVLCVRRATVWRLGRGGLLGSTPDRPALFGLDRRRPA